MYDYLNLLANMIINAHFTTTKCLFVFVDNNTIFEYEGNAPKIVLSVDLLTRNPKLYTRFLCDGFVINTENPKQSFVQIENSIRRVEVYERFNSRKYLILPTEKSSVEIVKIFDTNEINYVADVLAISKKSDCGTKSNSCETSFILLTHKYTGVTDNNEVVVLDEWILENSSFLHNSNLYPDKLSNQMGRKIRVGSFTYKPYVILDVTIWTFLETLDGTEMSVAMELAKKHNLSIEVVVDYDGLWGEIYENLTGYGIVGSLAMDLTDLGFGSMFMWLPECYYLDVSKPVVRSGINCLVPAPKLLGGWVTIFMAYSNSMWIGWIFSVFFCFGALLIVSSLNVSVKCIRNSRENVIGSILRTEALFLSQPVRRIPKKFFSRTVYALAMILGLILATVYNTGLASNMTVPRYHGVIKNSKDLVKSGILWGGTSRAWIQSIETSYNSIERQLAKTFIITDEKHLQKFNTENFGYVMENLQGGNVAIGDFVTLEGAKIRRLMDEDIYFNFICMYTRKGSILSPLLDNLLLEIAQAGLLKYWEYKNVVVYLDARVQTVAKFSRIQPKTETIPLSFGHVEGAFALWAVGLFVSTICFLIEIL